MSSLKSEWSIAEAHTAPYPYQVRFRKFDNHFPRGELPQRLNIFWSMSESNERGYATEGELARLHSFEDRLVEAVESDLLAVLVMVLTGEKEREFVFYTRHPQEFVDRLTAMPQETERYPIGIQRHDDPAWTYYESELRTIRA